MNQLLMENNNNKYYQILIAENYLNQDNSLTLDAAASEKQKNFRKTFDIKKLQFYNQESLKSIFANLATFRTRRAKIQYNHQGSRPCPLCKKMSCRSCTLQPLTDTELSKMNETLF